MDPIGTELAEAAASSVSNSLRNKIARAVFRLIAGGPGFKYLDEVRKNEATIEGRKKIDAIVAEEVARQAIADPDYMERAKARFLGDMLCKQENIEAVARAASDEILQLDEADILTDSEDAPTDDWMNAFTREAEMASSDDLRNRLGKILAGEIRRPGTYSRATVRTIAEIEQNTLEAFKDLLRYRFDEIILKGEKWDGGERFQTGNLLQANGLINASSLTNLTMKFTDDELGHIRSGNNYLVIEGETGKQLNIPVWLLTRIGLDLAELLDVSVDVEAVRGVVDGWKKDSVRRIYYSKGVPLSNSSRVRVPIDTLLYEAPKES